MYILVREHIPLEQGLRRLYTRPERRFCRFVREHIPLEQGLRPISIIIVVSTSYRVREHIPLEQGLRLTSFFALELIFLESESIFH